MKQVNLKEFNIEELRFTLWPNLTDDLVEEIRSVVAPDEDGDYLFMESYKIGNVGHFVGAVVSKLEVEGSYRIRVFCEIGRGGRLGKSVVSVSKLFEIISSVKEDLAGICMLKLSFGRRKKYKKIISLPIKITDMPNAIYDEIRGMHFTKNEGRIFKYDVILDIEPDGALKETITYRKMININESILEDIIREGIEISDRFVLREKQ